MHCPRCQKNTKVEETREGSDGQIRRYRRCTVCHNRFSTVEQLDVSSIQVVKTSGGQEPFRRQKLAKSIRKAVGREIPVSELNELVDRVVQSLLADEATQVTVGLADNQTEPTVRAVTSRLIGEKVLAVLGSELAYRVTQIRYALLFCNGLPGYFSDAASFLHWMNTEAPKIEERPTLVVKRSGSVEPFNPDKLKDSIRVAAKKRPNTVDEERASDELGELIYEAVLEVVRYQYLVTSGQLASEVMRALHPKVGPEIRHTVLSSGARELAYLRVASTAKNFSRAQDFVNEAAGLTTRWIMRRVRKAAPPK